jgi:GTPase SAR1 family protein
MLLAILLFGSQFAYSKIECQRASTLVRLETSNSNLILQLSQLKSYLEDGTEKNFSPSTFFGHDFDLSKTDEKIQNIESIIATKKGLAPEHQSLEICLIQLGLEDELNKLIENSTQFYKYQIILLKKNKDLKDSVRTGKLTQNELPSIKDKIDRENKETLNTRLMLEDDLLKKEIAVNKEIDNTKKVLLNYEGELTKVRIELLNTKIRSNEALEKKIKRFEKSSSELQALSTKIDSRGGQDIVGSFEKLEILWLGLSKENYSDYFKKDFNYSLPVIPNALELINGEQKQIDPLNSQRMELIVLRDEIRKQLSEKRNYEIKLLNQIISSSNSLRSSFFNKAGQSYFIQRIFSAEAYSLIKNELISSPHRFISYFHSKYLYVEEKISNGKAGYVDLFVKLLQFLLFMGSFFTLKYVFSKFNSVTDKFLSKYLYRSKGSNFFKRLISIWNKLKNSSVDLLWLLVVYSARKFLELDDVLILLDIAEVIIFAKILKSMITHFLGTVSRLDLGNFSKFKLKANETSNKFKNIFMFYCLTMIVIEVTVGQVYLYTLLNYIILFYSIYNVIKESSKWEEEFRRYAEKSFSGAVVEKYFNALKIAPPQLRSLLILVFILLFMIFNVFISYTENFELSKKISANLFKKQIERVEAEEGSDGKIPSSYKNEFSLKSMTEDEHEDYVETATQTEEKILSEIKEWTTEKSEEHSLVVYGDKGVGKTTLLKMTGLKLKEEDVDVKYVKLPSKTVDKNSVIKFLTDIFEENGNPENFDILRYDQQLTKKTVLIIDETQNIFLSNIGGFEAYYTLVNIINLDTENIFWVMSFNKYSWLYLDRAFGRTQYFRNVLEIKGWSDLKIKELIMKRHKKTGFQLSYDLLISATRSQDEIDKYASVESKFFKLLWELSNGNPRAALYLWISALSRKRSNVFNVNIPKEVDLGGIDKLSDDLMFVVANVLKHENLSFAEIEATTDLPRGIVRNSIKQGLERHFFYKDDRERYMVEISTQHSIVRYLKLKNFIYGN